jgi:hypothetical protein
MTRDEFGTFKKPKKSTKKKKEKGKAKKKARVPDTPKPKNRTGSGWWRAGAEYVRKIIVAEHSQGSLSFASDRLPALAGTASELEKAWGDRYLVGLLQKTFLKQLGWTLEAPYDDTDLPLVPDGLIQVEYQASSWYWLSMPEGVEINMPGAGLGPCKVTGSYRVLL